LEFYRLSTANSRKLAEGLAAESLFSQIAQVFAQIVDFLIKIAEDQSKEMDHELSYQYLEAFKQDLS
jgi:hypothetical protein